MRLYRKTLKSWGFGKEGPQNFCSERVTIAKRQGTSEFGIFLLGLLCVFAGCNFEPRYETPSTAVSMAWKNVQPESATSAKVENWWEIFQDPLLEDLIKQAVENNQDIAAAGERVEQARDMAKIARSKLFPQINLNSGYSNSDVLTQLYGPGLPHRPFVTREHQLEYALPLTMTYELDLWGKIRSAYKAGNLNAEAQEEALRTTRLIVTTDLASAYFQLRSLDAQIDLLSKTLDTAKTALQINQSRFQGQVINYTDVTLSQQNVNNIESEYFDAKKKRAVFENMIAVLLGASPSEFTLTPMPITAIPPEIPAGTPSAILLRRPDIAQQEKAMASIHAKLGIAYASYFPSVDLVGSLGYLSPLSKDFFKWISRYWLIAANITEVIFDGKARYYNVQLTWAQFRESVANYRQAALNAFQEVEDSLSNLQWISKQMESIGAAVQAARTDYNLSRARYEHGVGTYLPVADKQQTELDNARAYQVLLGLRYLNTVQLIKALGGGW